MTCIMRDGEEIQFNTNSGKIELYVDCDCRQKGLMRCPVYTPAPWTPPEGFYHLNYGRAPMHTFSRTANNPNLTDLMDENLVWVNPKVAKEWGFKNGQPGLPRKSGWCGFRIFLSKSANN
jgi:thiosulfate reductase / polysulfide reductase chain A